jgi:exopolysaccharide production protein ExoQ
MMSHFGSASPAALHAQNRSGLAIAPGRLPINVVDALWGLLAFFGLFVLSEAPTSLLARLGIESGIGALWLVPYAIGLAGLFRFPLRSMQLLSSAWPLFLISLMAIVSVVWSINPALSGVMAFRLNGTVLFAFFLVAAFSWQGLIQVIAATGLFLGVTSAVLALGPGNMGIMTETHVGAWSGWWLEKNRFGSVMAFAIVASATCAVLRRSVLWAISALFLFVLLILSDSATSLLATLAALGMAFVIWIWRRGPVVLGVTLYGGVAVLAAIVIAVTTAPEVVTDLLGREATFTGRTGIWQEAIGHIQIKPWFGWGYGAFWDTDPGPADWVRERLDFKASNAHNGWLDMSLELGLIGTLVTAINIVLGIIATLALLARHRIAYWGAMIIVMLLIFAISESVLWQANSFIGVVTLSALFAVVGTSGQTLKQKKRA